jgi:hypothetical protein
MLTAHNTRSARPSRCALTPALLMAFAACTGDGPSTPQTATQSPTAHLHPMAFIVDVDARTRVVTVTPPQGVAASAATFSLGGAERPLLSLLGGDAVRLVVTDYRASTVGAVTPNRIRVTFAVAIENRLPGIRLVTPTWPTPPADGLILFPVDYVVTLAPGSAAGNGGNVVTLEQPRAGAVTPSLDFDGTGAPGSGAPFNFFRDERCGAASSSLCFRWKAFPEAVPALGRSAARTIGFDIDPSVAQFRARLIVAADLAPMEHSIPQRGAMTLP